ncbi:hypothetical protein G3567_13265 [Psychroflexus sp. YR1-1]|uniref:Cxxc_20_cxxc protein n=1 Tax=Psychroflexus aurantiacus TaxID=2709310 RepID=A0A6B3R7B8_9FLAO|nr:hypothetical protein [Psychroflexus aurantiacus]NEV95105.1 hypothetical protein [Psychroflexus aurantiacus]
MKVYGKCKNCRNEIGYSTEANTRVEFAMKDGETKTLNCKNCGNSSEFHVDELIANRSKSPLILAGISFLLVIGVSLYFLIFGDSEYVYFSIGLPFVIYFILDKQDQTRVSSFNRRNLKGRVHNI